VNLAAPERMTRVSVQSAEDMLAASLDDLESCDIFIASAAVADYRPTSVAEHKMKKGNEEIMELHLVKNPDIVATVAGSPDKPFTVGFAAETRDVLSYARGKLERKNLDMIVANDVSRTDIGFNSDENAVTVITPDSEQELPQASKRQLAGQIIEQIARSYHKVR